MRHAKIACQQPHLTPDIMYNSLLMDIEDLTCAMDRFVTAKGWYLPDSQARRPQEPGDFLSIEAAEVLELFQWSEKQRHPDELASELADVMLYLLQLARLTGIDLETA